MKRIILAIAALLVLFLLFLIPAFLQSPPPAVVLPSPNGWDTLASIGRRVAIPALLDEAASAAENAQFWETHERTFDEVQEALTQVFVMPPVIDSARFEELTDDFTSIRSCFQLMSARGKLAEQEERWLDAANEHLRVYESSRLLHTNSLAVQHMAACSFSEQASQGLIRVAPRLTAEERNGLAKKLKTLSRGRIDKDGLIEREMNLPGGNPITRLMMSRERRRRVEEVAATLEASYAAQHLSTLSAAEQGE